ncbi:hypothetical protein [Laribacter hongkongensis]|uniref:hypothetical protein n=1 Tax=Laribacter hongkongensis TaxID=168471 RepID=UPI001EFD19B2|nr:hypothetical protein [Laribacter hongkongensis]MCG9041977.1 hypothetical protein [Laribacter hongkongensis]MCG9069019.1 hypothetical protein [Laribacter hongkongensis]
MDAFMESLADIEALALKCHSEESKTYIREAILSYRAGAYRSAIVGSWIALFFDLIDKIRELAASGDAAAERINKDHESIQEMLSSNPSVALSRVLEFERNILQKCRTELELFDSQQMSDLGRLKEDRNRCAHPSFAQLGTPYRPSAEQARLHLRNVIVHVLSQPPVQGKVALARLYKTIESDYFPDDYQKIRLQLEKAGLNKPKSSLVRAFISGLIYKYINPDDQFYCRKYVLSTINVVRDMFPSIVDAEIKKHCDKIVEIADDNKLFVVVILISSISNALDFVDNASKSKISTWIERCSFEHICFMFADLYRCPDMRPYLTKRIEQLSLDEIKVVPVSMEVSEHCLRRSISLLSSAFSFNAVNSIFKHGIFPFFEFITRELAEQIISLPTTTATDMIGSTGYSKFIEMIRIDGLIDDPALRDLLIANKGEYLIDFD